jgi:hypothetical protein
MEVRDAANAKDVKFYTTDRLREEFHIGAFSPRMTSRWFIAT